VVLSDILVASMRLHRPQEEPSEFRTGTVSPGNLWLSLPFQYDLMLIPSEIAAARVYALNDDPGRKRLLARSRLP
jgi:hypothetical protein